MRIISQQDRLLVSEIGQLTATEAAAFRSALLAALGPEITRVELDLAHTDLLDCAGLGALIALRKTLRQRSPQATLSLSNPPSPVQRLLQLTRTDHLFAPPAQDYARAEPAAHF